MPDTLTRPWTIQVLARAASLRISCDHSRRKLRAGRLMSAFGFPKTGRPGVPYVRWRATIGGLVHEPSADQRKEKLIADQYRNVEVSEAKPGVMPAAKARGSPGVFGHGPGAAVPGTASRMSRTEPAALGKWSASLQNVWSVWRSSNRSPGGSCSWSRL